MLKVAIYQDPDCRNPLEGDVGLVSFNRKHLNFEEPAKYFDDEESENELQAKLFDKTAFILSYFEHGACVWGLQGEVPQCQWDTKQVAGILFLPEDVPEDRREDFARATLRDYSSWCNGECYGYVVEDDRGKDSCWGFIGDRIFEAVAEVIDGREYEIEDDYYRSLIEDAVKEEKARKYRAAQALQEALAKVAKDYGKLYDLLGNYCSEEREGAKIGPDVVNEFVDMVDRAVQDTE